MVPVVASRRDARSPEWVVAGLVVCVVARAALSGSVGASSMPAAAVFAVMASALAWWAGWRPSRPSVRVLGWGAIGGLMLLVGPAWSYLGPPPVTGAGPARVGFWLVVVTAVAGSEEALLRGALWAALDRHFGRGTALAATTLLFAVMHVPLYGWHAVPLDLAVGLLLGGLRLITAGPGAPAMAHVLADVMGGWL